MALPENQRVYQKTRSIPAMADTKVVTLVDRDWPRYWPAGLALFGVPCVAFGGLQMAMGLGYPALGVLPAKPWRTAVYLGWGIALFAGGLACSRLGFGPIFRRWKLARPPNQ